MPTKRSRANSRPGAEDVHEDVDDHAAEVPRPEDEGEGPGEAAAHAEGGVAVEAVGDAVTDHPATAKAVLCAPVDQDAHPSLDVDSGHAHAPHARGETPARCRRSEN